MIENIGGGYLILDPITRDTRTDDDDGKMETVVTLTHNCDFSDDDKHLTASGSDMASSRRCDGSSDSEYQPSPDKKCKVQSVITVFDDNTLENIYDDCHVRGFSTYDKLLKKIP